MPNWTRRGFLTAVFAAPLAGWSGFWPKKPLNWLKNPLFTRAVPPVPGQIWLKECSRMAGESLATHKAMMAAEFCEELQRGFLGLPPKRRGGKVMMVLGGDQEDAILGNWGGER